MNLANLCTREVVGIDAAASVREAATLMCDEHVGALVVLTADEPPQVVGVVTDRDLALEVLGRPDGAGGLRIGEIVRGRPMAVPGTASVRDAVESMRRAGVRRLLVVDDDGGVVGLVSSDDLLEAIAHDLASLAESLRVGIQREKTERKVMRAPVRARAMYPSFGTVAAQ